MYQKVSVVIAADPARALVLLDVLRQGGFEPRYELASTPGELSQALAADGWDVLLVADDLPSLSVEAALAQRLHLPVLVLAATANLDTARAALSSGAADVIWPAHLERLPLAVERVLLTGVKAQVNPYQDGFIGNRAVQLLVDSQTGQLVDANQSAATFYGYPLVVLRQMTVWQLNATDTAETHAILERAFREPGNMLVSRHHLASGEVRDVDVYANPVQQGNRALLYCIVSDVTDRQRRERELEVMAAFAAALRTAPSRATLAPAIVDNLRQLTGAASAALIVLDPRTGDLVTELAVNWGSATGTRQPPGAGLASQVITSGQPQWREMEPLAAASGGEVQRFAVGAPLLAQGQTLGALCVSSAAAPDNPQLRLLRALGDMAANALHRSTLYEQTEQRAQRLTALHAIDIAITASFDLRVTLGIFLDHLINLLQVDAAAVLLLNASAQSLEYVATRGLNTQLPQPAPLRLSDSLPGRVAIQRQALQVGNLQETRLLGTRPYPPGQHSFTSYYGVPLVAKGRVQGVLEVFSRGALRPDAEWVEFFNSLATQAAIAIDNATLFADLQRSNVELNLAYDATIEAWSRVLEARGVESNGHTRRVADLTVKLAQSAGFSKAELIHIRRGALLHDIGMLTIPEAVLLKPAVLSEAERAIVRQHPDYGFGILAPIVYLRPALEIPHCHHERWDGSGYPRGLHGELIPPAARLFAVVDSWDALRADRPYRPAWTEAAALAYLETNAGKQFDPTMVKLFVQQVAS